MYAITGITGKVGGALAGTLLAANQPVRGVVRDADKAGQWTRRGCEIAVASMNDASTLAAAFEGVTGVFILPPSEFDPAPGFPEARAVIDAVMTALQRSHPGKVVCLSTIGAQAAPNEPAHATHADGTGTLHADDSSDLLASGMVHGELRLGRGLGTRPRPDREFSATVG